jgi:hypothetical protein
MTGHALHAEHIVDVLTESQMQFVTEAELQAEIATALAAAGVDAVREVRLSDGVSRIDLMSADVGIEVKTNGSWADVFRQLTRYAHCPEIRSLVLVSTRTRHHHLPPEVAGVPLRLVSMVGASL